MCDSELKRILTSTEMHAQPDPVRVQAVRERMMLIGSRSGVRLLRHRSALLVTLLTVGASGIGLAATETGRNFIRWVFTPIQQAQSAKWEAPDGGVWTRLTTGRAEPVSPEERDDVSKQFAENYASKEAGEGRLVGLIEGPGFGGFSQTVYLVEYTRETGEKNIVGSSRPSGKQAENMRLDEIMRLRDAGEGTIIKHDAHPIGMGKYLIRFTLSDGATVDLTTFFPPGTKEEREQIFAEMRELKAALRFTVVNAHFDAANPIAGVWGIIQYRLADGRLVGATEQLPQEVISEDGTEVVMPDQDARVPIEGSTAKPD